MNRKIGIALLLALSAILLASYAMSVSTPEGPGTLNQVYSARRIPFPAPTLEAEAGNISHLEVRGKTVTQSWQGFVGNVSGLVVLDDARNFTLYNWSVADPRGEIYATYLPDVDWTAGMVTCWNMSKSTDDPNYLSLGELEGWEDDGWASTTKNLSVASTDPDGVNETFTFATGHDAFFVGGYQILADTCPAVKLFNASSIGEYEEVLLYANRSAEAGGIIYTAIINQNKVGYDGGTWDFEMIVGENGHNGDTSVTTYSFYVELN